MRATWQRFRLMITGAKLRSHQRSGTRSPSRLALLLGVTLCSALAACGGSSHQSSPPSGSSTAPQTTVSVPAYNPAKNARRDVVAGPCIDGSSGWSLSGTVTNSTGSMRGYSIVVDFITVPGDTVIATKLVTVPPVSPHASAKWSATGAAPGVRDLTCVIRQSLFT
jgi:hypothetical protein